jgi:two-component system, LuxR family, sensor kinase FixL
MMDYAQLTRAELIGRLRALESRRAGAVGTTGPLNAAKCPARTASSDSAQRLRAILETAVEGIITIDDHGLIESMNPAAEKTFRCKASQLIGRNVSILMPSPHREEHDGYMESYLRTGKAKIIGIGREVLARRMDGTLFPIELAVSEVHLADRRLFTGFIRDITERKRLEQEILAISDREKTRIGQDLHDGLCQQLAGIELMSQALQQNIGARSKADAARAGDIAGHVREAIRQTRLLARGLCPVTLESEGFVPALQELAANTEKLFHVACRFECHPPVRVRDQAVATHLFRIAQEAVSNAIKHGKATRLRIRLTRQHGQAVLAVTDNGTGFPAAVPTQNGMGLRIMQSRAGMIGGTLTMENHPEGGARVLCTVALPDSGIKPKANARGRQNEKS